MNATNKNLLKTYIFYNKIYSKGLFFSKYYETIYLDTITIGSILAILTHLLLLYIALKKTPKDMKTYK